MLLEIHIRILVRAKTKDKAAKVLSQVNFVNPTLIEFSYTGPYFKDPDLQEVKGVLKFNHVQEKMIHHVLIYFSVFTDNWNLNTSGLDDNSSYEISGFTQNDFKVPGIEWVDFLSM